MKRAIMAAAMLALACAGPAIARTGEVPLHIEAVGEVAPDVAMVTVTQQQRGASAAAADLALDRQHAELTRRLGELGVAAGDIAWQRDEGSPGMTADTLEDGSAAKAPSFYANATATVTLRDADKLPALTTALAAMSDAPTIDSRSIRYSFADVGAAREKAIQRGFARARRDAEAYAAAAQMRIARIERVSNAKSPMSAIDMQQLVGRFVGMIDERSFPREAFSNVIVSVAVDYVLVP